MFAQIKTIFLNKILFYLVFLIPLSGYSQREANIWYFGNKAGIDFNSGKPEPLNNSAMNSWEGSASISDTLGNLLFYTDGMQIWNRNHQVMPNSEELNGDTNATQSAVIIKQNRIEPIYYVFTVDSQAQNRGFEYSVVDMRLNNGLGDVLSDQKNILLFTPSAEKVTAVQHQNKNDTWILAHTWNNANYYAYLLNENGLQEPVITTIGSVHSPDQSVFNINSIGYLRASNDGTKIACALAYNSTVEIFNFDNSTGILSDSILIQFPQIAGTYGVEFSPDVSKLYVSSTFQLYQINLLAGTPADIINSVVELHTFDTYPSALQLAPDGRIYLSLNQHNRLTVINNPDSLGPACNLLIDTLFLEGGIARMGLPNFNTSYLIPPNFRVSDNCIGDSVNFQITDVVGIDSVLWNFGDILSGLNNTSNLLNPKHLYPLSGIYRVVLKLWKNGNIFLSHQNIQVTPLPVCDIGQDTTMCNGFDLTLHINNRNLSAIWSDFSTDSVFTLNQPGTYSVKVTNKYTGCINFDTIHVEYVANPEIFLGNDTSFCKNTQLMLNAYHSKYIYLWNTLQTDSAILITHSGDYWVSVTDSFQCKNEDTIHISEYPLPEFFLGNDTVICYGTSLLLESHLPNVQYLWQNASHDNFYFASSEGKYWLQLTDSVGCIFTDSLMLKYKGLPTFDLGNDTTLCEHSLLILQPDTIFTETTSFLWNTGSEDIFWEPAVSGFYKLSATDKCGSYNDSIYVNFEYCGPIDIPNIFTPNDDGINDVFFIKGIEQGRWLLSIYSRWGNLMFQSDNYQNNWSPKDISSDVYYYLLSEFGTNRNFKGFVHVLK